MLIHPTLELLQRLRLNGMYRALQEQLQMPEIDSLSFEERLGLLLERELTERETRRLNTRLKQAKLRENAAIEDLDYRTHRGLDKALMTRLASCQWISKHLNVLINGPTGVGKTWVACALAQKACREGFSARYLRLPRLLQQLGIARADGSYPKLLADWTPRSVHRKAREAAEAIRIIEHRKGREARHAEVAEALGLV
jgi:DNA replication protein DnaC